MNKDASKFGLYPVEVEITRKIVAVVEASDKIDARNKANNLELTSEINQGVVGWKLLKVGDLIDGSNE